MRLYLTALKIAVRGEQGKIPDDMTLSGNEAKRHGFSVESAESGSDQYGSAEPDRAGSLERAFQRFETMQLIKSVEVESAGRLPLRSPATSIRFLSP